MTDFGVSNTTADVTNVGPLSQQLSIAGPSVLTISGAAPTLVPISIATLKQAALSGVVINVDPVGASTSDFTLNKKPGALNGTVSGALITEFNLTEDNSSAILKFHTPSLMAGTVRLSSDDAQMSITAAPINLFTPGTAPGETHVIVTRSGVNIISVQRHTTTYVVP